VAQKVDTINRATFYIGKLNAVVHGIRTATPTKGQLEKAEFLLLNKEISNTITGFDMKISVSDNRDSVSKDYVARDMDSTIRTPRNRKSFVPLHSSDKYITREMIRAIKKCDEGSMVVFYNIKVRMESGQVIILDDLRLYIVGEEISGNRRVGNKGGKMDPRFL
jgi:hypothetical protein